MKICNTCKMPKRDKEYSFIKTTGKYKAKCKSCNNLRQKELRSANLAERQAKEQAYREANRERIRTQYPTTEYKAQYYRKNKDTILKRHKKYNTVNSELISLQKAEYYKLNKEHILARSSKYYAEHRDECYAKSSKRRALLANASTLPISEEEQFRIKLLYKIARKVQHITGVNMHVDHIYPLNGKTVSGFHCLSNLQILTAEENLKKSNKFPDDKYTRSYNGSKAINISTE